MMSKVTFILGAGTSLEYGYPSNIGLRSDILDYCNQRDLFGQNYLEKAGFQRNEIDSFSQDFLLSSKHSIDSFLEWNKYYNTIGKFIIAQVLLNREARSRQDLFVNTSMKFYDYLFNELIKSPQDIEEGKLNFITFNYDVSLKEFLFNYLSKSFSLGLAETKILMERIPIIYLHGCLGKLNWEDSSGRSYSNTTNFTTETIKKIASEIQIIHDDIDKNKLNDAHKILKASNNIFIIGFGYHELNLERLRLNEIYIENKSKNNMLISGSTYGFTESETTRIKNKINHTIHVDSRFKAIEFLRHNGYFQSLLS